jgi:hypothetical protein
VDAVSSITRPLIPFREEFLAVEMVRFAPVKSAFDNLEWRLSVEDEILGCCCSIGGNGGRFSRLAI